MNLIYVIILVGLLTVVCGKWLSLLQCFICCHQCGISLACTKHLYSGEHLRGSTRELGQLVWDEYKKKWVKEVASQTRQRQRDFRRRWIWKRNRTDAEDRRERERKHIQGNLFGQRRDPYNRQFGNRNFGRDRSMRRRQRCDMTGSVKDCGWQ